MKRSILFVLRALRGLVYAVYLIAARAALYLLTLYLCVYFLVNSSHFKGILEPILASVYPGRIVANSYYWGPLPWQFGGFGARVLTPCGATVIEADYLDGEIDLGELLGWVARRVFVGDEPFQLDIRRVVVRGFRVVLDFDELNTLHLVDAFSDRKKRKEPRKYLVRVANAVAMDGRVVLRFPRWELDVQVERAEADLVAGRRFRLRSRLVSISRGLGTVDVSGEPGGEKLRSPIGPTIVQGFSWHRAAFEVARVQSRISETLSVDATLGMSFRDDVPTLHGVLRADASPMPAALRGLLGDRVSGAATVLASSEGSFDDLSVSAVLRSPELTIDGRDIRGLDLAVEMARKTVFPGLRPYVVRVPRARADVLDGQLRVADLWYQPVGPATPVDGPPQLLPTEHRFGGELWLQDVSLASLPSAGVFGALPPPLRGRVSGAIAFRGGNFRRFAETSWEAGAEFDLSMDWGPSGAPRRSDRWPLASRYGLAGALQFFQRWPPHIESRERTGVAPVVLGHGLRLTSGADSLRFGGAVALGSGELALRAEGVIARLADVLEPFGVRGVDGRLRIGQGHVEGPISRPHLEAKLTLSELRVGARALGEVTTQVSLQDGNLRLRRLRASGAWGQIETAGSVQLLPAADPQRRPRPYRFTLEKLSATDLALAELWPGARLSGRAELSLEALSGDLLDPFRTLRGSGRLAAREVRVGSARIVSAGARVSVEGGSLLFADADVQFRGGGRVRGEARFLDALRRVALDLRLEPLRIASLPFVGRRGLPVSGRVSARLRVDGSLGDPELDGTVSVRGARLHPAGRVPGAPVLRLGDADVDISREPRGPLRLSAGQRFFDGFALLDGSAVTMRGSTPRAIDLRLGVRDLDVATLLPELTTHQISARVSAEADIYATLGGRDVREPWKVTLGVGARDLRIGLRDDRYTIDNPGPIEVAVGPRGVTVPSLLLRGSDGSVFAACGRVDGRGRLDAALTGTVEAEPFRLLFRRSLSRLEGSVSVTGELTGRPEGCRREGPWENGEALRVTGRLSSPLFEGKLVLSGFRLQPRGFGREFSITGPAGVELAPVRGEHRQWLQRVRIPEEAPLAGAFEDGSFTIWGEALLAELVPREGRWDFRGEDIYYSSPKTFNATFDPALTMTFRDMDDPQRRQSRLSGLVAITDGVYYRSFDRLARAFGGAVGREMEAPTQSITRAVPSSADMALDVRVTGANFAVTTGFPFGTTDLELRFDIGIRGTLANPLIRDRIELIPGGLITYKIVRREFEVVRGTLDFRDDPVRPFLDLEARTEIDYYDDQGGSLDTLDTTLRDDERAVTITIRVTGQYPEIDVELSSDNRGFDQADLQSFILTGAPSSGQGETSEQSIHIFTEDIANLARKLLLSAFVDAVTLGVTPEGGIDWGMVASLGRGLKLRTRVVQEGAQKRYRARFEFRITDRLSLEGQLRVNEDEDESIKTYESKLRYRIPLD